MGEHNFEALDERLHEDYIIVGRNEPGFLSATMENDIMILTLGRDVNYKGQYPYIYEYFSECSFTI